VCLLQVRQNTEMESHEEKLHKMIIQVGWLSAEALLLVVAVLPPLRLLPFVCVFGPPSDETILAKALHRGCSCSLSGPAFAH
jgi:hypothetical protein